MTPMESIKTAGSDGHSGICPACETERSTTNQGRIRAHVVPTRGPLSRPRIGCEGSGQLPLPPAVLTAPQALVEEQVNTRIAQEVLGQRDQEIRTLRLDLNKAREAVEERDQRIQFLVAELRAARACLVEHVDCSEPQCRAEIAKALAE